MTTNLPDSEVFEFDDPTQSHPVSEESPVKLQARAAACKEDNKGNSPVESLVESISTDGDQFLTSLKNSKK